MRIAIIGAGYVGVARAACFAKLGHNVMCFDVDRERIDRLARHEMPIYELKLDLRMDRCRGEGELVFTPLLH